MIKFNKNNNMIIPFTILLANRNQDILGEIVNTSGVNFTGNFNAADELSFTVNKTLDGYDEPLWDEIYDLRLIYIQELKEYFQIAVSFTDQTYLTKTITATSLCEAELSQTMLYDIEINTELDIERPDYKVAKFWTSSTDLEDIKTTILYRVLEKVPAYSIKHVDPTLVNLQRVFKISDKSVYDWLVNECATEFNCLVKFDSTDRSISFYDLYTTCPICHTRGLFNDSCTHIITAEDIKKYGHNGTLNGKYEGDVCGNTDLNYYGDDTTILVSTENLTNEIKFDTDIDSIKNSFRLVAGDDDMTAAIVNINPTGSQYIYNFSPESIKDMPDILVDSIKAYNKLYDEYRYTHEFQITNKILKKYSYDYKDYTSWNNRINDYNIIEYNDITYNDLVNKYKVSYKAAREDELLPLPGIIKGYTGIMQYLYQCYDFYSYLESSMMPKVEIGQTSAAIEAAKLTRSKMGGTVSITRYTQSTSISTINSALINYAKIFIKIGFVSIEIDPTSTYTAGTESGIWQGRFIIKDNSLDDDDTEKTAYSANLRFEINDDYETFIKQKIKKKIAKDLEENEDFTNLLMLDELSTFQNNIRLYSMNRLRSFKDSLEAVLGIMQEANIALNPDDQKSSIKKEMYGTFYKPFLMKFKMCEEEMNLRANELRIIARYTNDTMVSGVLYELLMIKNQVHKALDLKAFLDKQSKEYNQNHYGYEKATPKMTSNTQPSGTVSASHYHNDNYMPFYAFNENIANDPYTWATTQSLPQWICYKFDEPVCIKKLITYHRNERNIRAVSNFIFQGSNNGNTWKTIGECEISEKTAHYKAEFDFEKNKKKYLYYRLYVTDNFNNSTGTGCGFAEIEMYKPKYIYDDVDLYKLLTTYIRQDTYNNSNYISTGLNNEDLFQMAQMFYDAATEELLKSSTYQHSISANLYNLLTLDEFKPIVNSFELGNWIRVMTDDQLYRLRLISYSVNFDDPTSLNTEFSDVTMTGVGYNDLQSLLNQAGTMATSFPSVTKQAELGKLANTNINKWVEKGLDSTKTRIMNNDTEEIEITNVGITAKTFNDITGEYDPQQLRITHNVLAFTDDNWETVKTAVGRFLLTYYEPHVSSINEIEKEYYGIVAEAVLAGWVVGSTIIGSNIIGGHIQNAGNSAYIDLYNSVWKDPDGHVYNDFIHVEDGVNYFRITKKGNFITSGGHFSDPNDDVYLDLVPYPNPNPESGEPYYDYFLKIQDVFCVSKKDATIMSKGGHFQNADNTSYIDLGEDGDKNYLVHSDTGELLVDTSVGRFYFLLCKDWDIFSVTKDGYLTSTSGYIGGFHISDNYISSTKNLTDTQNAITLSNTSFTRNIWKSKATVDSEGKIVSYTNTDQTVSGLRFAIDKFLGVTSDGDVYMSRLHTGSVETDILIGKNLYINDSDDNIAHISASTIDLSGSDSITILGKIDDPSSVNIPFGANISGLIISGTNLHCENPNDYIGLLDGAYHITKDNIIKFIGNIGYDAAWIQAGTEPVGSTLDKGIIYLQYE